MKLIFIVALSGAVFAGHNAKGEKFSDQHRAAVRKVNHISDEWIQHCKKTDQVPDLQLGCVAPKAPDKPVEIPKSTESK